MRTSGPVTVALALSGLLVGGAVPAAASEVREADQLVVAESSGSGPRTVTRSAVEVVVATGGTVDNENVARAVSQDCTGCRAIAASFQAVLVPGTPSTVVPQNGAAAFNVSCTSCTTAAFAYQYVVSTKGVTKLDEDAREDIEDIEEDLREVVRSGWTGERIAAAVDRLEAEFRAAVDAGLVGEEREDEDSDADLEDDE